MDLAPLSRMALGFTFVWLLGWALWALRRLVRRDQNTLLFGLLLIFVLYGAPAGLDFVLGVPDYVELPGYRQASHDPLTVLVACAYLCLVPACWYLFCRRPIAPPRGGFTRPRRLNLRTRTLLHLVVALPLLALLFAPAPSLYKSYGVTVRYRLTPAQLEYHLYLRLLCIFALLAVARLLPQQRRLFSLQSLYLSLTSLAAVWIHGKRNVVAFAAFLVGYQLWQRGWLRRKHFVPALLLTGLLLTGYTQIYNRVVRDLQVTDYSTSQFLENARLDFCRDHVLRLVVHAELEPHQQILLYRGQSFLFTATMYVPRKLWPSKPMPYAMYVLSAVFARPPSDTMNWGYSHPTGLLDEAVANLGWFGMLVGPLLVVAIALLGNRGRTAQVRGLTALAIVMVLHLPVQSFTPLIAVWGWFLLSDMRRGSQLARARRSTPRSTR